MQTSRFQLALIATLAGGLGFSLSAPLAIGYPSGAAVSLGANPVWSVGGGVTDGATDTVVTAPADQDLVITDVILSPDVPDPTCEVIMRARMLLGSGDEVARYNLTLDSHSGSTSSGTMFGVDGHYISGIRIPAGDSLALEASTLAEGYTCSGKSVSYSLAGYFAQP